MVLVDIVGWAEAAALLTAYALVSARRLSGDAVAYQLMNGIGGLLLIVNSFYSFNLSL